MIRHLACLLGFHDWYRYIEDRHNDGITRECRALASSGVVDWPSA